LFQKQVEEDLPITVVGDGLQSRDFIHVSDVVEANIKAALTDNKKAIGEIINIGSGKSHTVMDLVKMIGDGFYINVPERRGEARHSRADISKAKTLLNWTPQVDLEEWLK
jgi:UDP-glucose 4-epimerase